MFQRLASKILLLAFFIFSIAFFFLTPQSVLSKEPDRSALFPVCEKGSRLWGYIDRRGRIVIKPRFYYAKEFSEGLADVNLNGKIGYIDTQGRIVISPKFDPPEKYFEYFDSMFSEGLAAVYLDGKVGYIDRRGEIVISPRFGQGHQFHEGIALVDSDNTSFHSSYIDKTGKEIWKFGPDDPGARSFSEGLSPVYKNARCGWIDKTGAIVIEAKYYGCGPFSQGLAVALVHSTPKNFKAGYVDASGKIVIPFHFDEAGEFSEGLAVVRIGQKAGYINKNGAVVIKPKFDFASPFSEGLAAIQIGSQFGFINHHGKVVIRLTPPYELVAVNDSSGSSQFHNGVANVFNGQRDNFIDKDGKIISRHDFIRGFSSFEHGLAQIRTYPNGGWGYIDKTGRYVWDPKKSCQP